MINDYGHSINNNILAKFVSIFIGSDNYFLILSLKKGPDVLPIVDENNGMYVDRIVWLVWVT